jgi:phosphopantothenoylcysteine decarboxylase / phosphopantothenate---cysteine ligase
MMHSLDKIAGKKVLITAGPTRENIDDVRFISNYSTGKMGYAIAEAAFSAGAEVILVSGPVYMKCSEGINRIDVISAEDMYQETIKHFADSDIAILSAAVADYTPSEPVTGKLKKDILGDSPVIKLKKTKDILANLGKIKTQNQFLVGFALESENVIENAKEKLIRKNCDMIIANQGGKELSGFGGDFNTITIIRYNNTITDYLPMTKDECAKVILNSICEMIGK